MYLSWRAEVIHWQQIYLKTERQEDTHKKQSLNILLLTAYYQIVRLQVIQGAYHPNMTIHGYMWVIIIDTERIRWQEVE